MPDNQIIAQKLREIYILMQLAGENRFRAIAFDRAAQSIESLDEPVSRYIENRNLTELQGIGSSIAKDIYEYAETGSMPALAKLREKVPVELIGWLDISGLGPKSILRIHRDLDILTIGELRDACLDGRVAGLKGLGEKSAKKIIRSIEWLQENEQRCLLSEAGKVAGPIVAFLEKLEGVRRVETAGSLRRCRETIGDVDLLVAAAAEDGASVFDAFTGHEMVVDVLGRGETKCSVRTIQGRQVDVRIVNPDQFPAAWLYFTGSKEHNVRMRQRARVRGLSLNEYGLFQLTEAGDADFAKPVDYRSEKDIYRKLDMNFVPPELREERGEFECYAHPKELSLVEDSDIRGVIHAHSNWSDGRYSIEEMARASAAKGYRYLGISDHSRSAAYAGGLTVEQVREQWREIDRLNEQMAAEGTGFVIFKGIESDILADGSLDYPDDLLQGFDFVIASVHSSLDMPPEKMTKRFLRAIEHPATRIIGHPSGRLLLNRGESRLDMDLLIEAAARNNTAIEINANPRRLDMDWRYGDRARAAGLLTSVNPDAHTVDGIDDIWYGVRMARKAKFNRERVLNTFPADKFKTWLEK
ncbi:MAG: DNA polymerase/3'-5' exonuclease PolX [Balneolaceae bacterium]